MLMIEKIEPLVGQAHNALSQLLKVLSAAAIAQITVKHSARVGDFELTPPLRSADLPRSELPPTCADVQNMRLKLKR
jgi:hypothetical protein